MVVSQVFLYDISPGGNDDFGIVVGSASSLTAEHYRPICDNSQSSWTFKVQDDRINPSGVRFYHPTSSHLYECPRELLPAAAAVAWLFFEELRSEDANSERSIGR